MLLSLAIGSFLVFMLLGMPIVFALGSSSLFALALASDVSLTVVPQRMVAQIDSFALLAVPFFVLAGMVMEQGGISARLINFASCLVAHFRGGLAMVCVLSSMIFAGVSGSTSADAAAIGAILIPAMIKRGYDRGFVASLQAASATMGPIIPPSTLAIIYGSLTNVSVGKLFLAGIVPGVMIGLALMVMTYFYAGKLGYPVERRATARETWESFRSSFWALMVPMVILGGIVSGVFTATESGVIAALYALFVALFVYRELSWRDLPTVLLRSSLTTAMVMIVIASAGVLSWILANERLPEVAHVFLTNVSSNPTVILFIILAIMLAIGCVMEIVAAAMIMIPVIFPIAHALGINDVHFGLLIVVTMALGAVTPPVGVTLYITLGLAGVPLSAVNRYIWPMVGIIVLVVIVCALVPPLVTFIPEMILGK
jgi:tripartite ATP-independent transporter DctM subunit